MTPSSSNKQSHNLLSFGAMLQQARKSKQLSLEDAADELFILKRHLQALEDENFADLPQAAFTRGFAINYAKFLGLDPVQVVSSFDAAYPNELKPRALNKTHSPLQPMGTLQRDTHSRIRFNPLLIVAIVALIILAIFLFRMVTNASQDNQEPMPAIDGLSASEQAQGAAIDNSGGINASGSALNMGSDMSAAALDMKLTDRVSITITDASGNRLMTGSQSRGDYNLTGVPPFTIQIDDVDKVSLQLNQQPVALAQYANGKQASFELTP